MTGSVTGTSVPSSVLPLVLVAILWTALPIPAGGQERQVSGSSAESAVERLYDLVTFPAGRLPDWEVVRSVFLPEALVVLRTTRTDTRVFTLEGFIRDWLDFIARSNAEATGFTERIVRSHAVEFGDIAHVWVLYEAEIPGGGRPPQLGVDSIELVRREGAWKIAAITNEVPAPDRALPEVLREGG